MKLIELVDLLAMIGIKELHLCMRRAEEMRAWKRRFSILLYVNRKVAQHHQRDTRQLS
jgi:hypothetical protein